MSRRQQDLFPDLPDGKKYVSDIPELVAQWHPAKNDDLNPQDVTHGSARKVWWLCSEGHEWEATINSRPRNGCPYCSNLYPSEGSSLLDCNPTACKEWDYEKNENPPSEYNPKSGKKVWWRCLVGDDHVWEARIASRTAPNDGVLTGCPFCAGRKPSKSYNLAVVHPELMPEWHYEKNELPPEQYVPKSNYPVWWQCIKGHEWKSKISNRANGRNCPECNIQSSRAEMRIFTELMTCFPNVMSRKKLEGFEVDIFIPDLSIGIEYDGSYWHTDKQDHDLKKQAALEALGVKLLRVQEKPLSKISANDIIVERAEELRKETVNKLLSLISPTNAATIDYLSKAAWVNDELYKSYLDNFTSPLPDNSLAEDNPNLCTEWHPTKNLPLLPINFTPNSGQKVWWLCSFGHEWEATIDSRNRKRRPSNCPYCSPTRKMASEENNMAKRRPDIAMYFHPTKNGDQTPEKLVEGTGKILWWQCELGHEWQQRGYAMLKTKGHLCPICRKTKI